MKSLTICMKVAKRNPRQSPAHSFSGPVSDGCAMLWYRAAPITVTQPVQFLQLVWATLLGWAVFGEGADAYVLLGGSIIVGSVVAISLRERTSAGEEPPCRIVRRAHHIMRAFSSAGMSDMSTGLPAPGRLSTPISGSQRVRAMPPHATRITPIIPAAWCSRMCFCSAGALPTTSGWVLRRSVMSRSAPPQRPR